MDVGILEAGLSCLDAPGRAALFDERTETVFGPLFYSGDEARDFLAWSKQRGMTAELLLLSAADGLAPLVTIYRREAMDAQGEVADAR